MHVLADIELKKKHLLPIMKMLGVPDDLFIPAASDIEDKVDQTLIETQYDCQCLMVDEINRYVTPQESSRNNKWIITQDGLNLSTTILNKVTERRSYKMSLEPKDLDGYYLQAALSFEVEGVSFLATLEFDYDGYADDPIYKKAGDPNSFKVYLFANPTETDKKNILESLAINMIKRTLTFPVETTLTDITNLIDHLNDNRIDLSKVINEVVSAGPFDTDQSGDGYFDKQFNRLANFMRSIALNMMVEDRPSYHLSYVQSIEYQISPGTETANHVIVTDVHGDIWRGNFQYGSISLTCDAYKEFGPDFNEVILSSLLVNIESDVFNGVLPDCGKVPEEYFIPNPDDHLKTVPFHPFS